MINKIVGWVALVIAIVGLFFPLVHIASFGGVTNYDALTLDNGNLTLRNGSISLANPSTGTSTLATIGCIQAYATSSATSVKFVFNTTATSSVSGTTNGLVGWQYGTCP